MNTEKKVVGAENVSSPVSRVGQERVNHSSPIEAHSANLSTGLDPAILAAINQAVTGAVKVIVDQLKPAQASPQAQGASKYPTPYVPPTQPYRSKLQGIPVQAGQDLRHVHPLVIREWFGQIQARAIQRLAAQSKRQGIESHMSIEALTPVSIAV